MRMAVQHMGENKRGLIQNSIQAIKIMHKYSPAGLVVKGIMNFIENINNGDELEVAKEKAIDRASKETNPNRSTFSIGQIVNHNGMSFEVLRFDEVGNPVFKKL